MFLDIHTHIPHIHSLYGPTLKEQKKEQNKIVFLASEFEFRSEKLYLLYTLRNYEIFFYSFFAK